MKKLMLQLLRTGVTIFVVGTMALMIFSLRGELAEARAKARTVGQAKGVPGLFETIRSRTSVRKFLDSDVFTPGGMNTSRISPAA